MYFHATLYRNIIFFFKFLFDNLQLKSYYSGISKYILVSVWFIFIKKKSYLSIPLETVTIEVNFDTE